LFFNSCVAVAGFLCNAFYGIIIIPQNFNFPFFFIKVNSAPAPSNPVLESGFAIDFYKRKWKTKILWNYSNPIKSIAQKTSNR
jgi:hypothetical protein